jgi:hypothetical protein
MPAVFAAIPDAGAGGDAAPGLDVRVEAEHPATIAEEKIMSAAFFISPENADGRLSHDAR